MKQVPLQAYIELTKCCCSVTIMELFYVPERGFDEPSTREAVSKVPVIGHRAASTHHSHLGALRLHAATTLVHEEVPVIMKHTHLTPTPVTESSIGHIHTSTHTTHHVAATTDWLEGGWLGEGWRWVWLDGRGLWWVWIKEILTCNTVELTGRIASTTTKTHCSVLKKIHLCSQVEISAKIDASVK